MPRSGPTRHVFVEDPEWSDPHMDEYYCRTCRLRRENAIHDLPQRTDEQREHEARRTGERDGR